MKAAAVALDRGAEVVDVVVAELLAERVGEDEREHRLGNPARRGHDADIAAFDVGRRRLARAKVGRGQWLHERRDRFERDLENDVLAVRHAALQAARAVALPDERAVPNADRIVHRASALAGRRERVGELHALRALDRHERLRDAPVEAAVPLRERSEARYDAGRPQGDDPAEGISGVAGGGDGGDHGTAALGIGAADLARLDRVAVEARLAHDVPHRPRLARALGPPDAAHRLRDCAGGDAGRRLPGTRPLDDVPHVGMPELERACEIGVTRAQPGHRIGWFRDGLDAHHAFPVHGVAVGDLECQRPARGAALAHATGDANGVPLDPLPRTATVPELPAPQVAVDVRRRHREARRDAVQDREHLRPVGLAGRQEPHTGRGRAARMTSSGAGTPVQSSNERAAWWRSMLRPSTTVTFSVAFARLTSGVSSAVGTRSITHIGSRTSSKASSPFSPSGVALTTASTGPQTLGHWTTAA